MVTHSSTSRPVQCLCMAERTGCPVLTDLWSYVQGFRTSKISSLKLMCVQSVLDIKRPGHSDAWKMRRPCSKSASSDHSNWYSDS